MQSYKFKFFLDDEQSYFLEVEAQRYTDTSDWPFQDVVEVNAVSFMGSAMLRMFEIPPEIMKKIEEQAALKQPQS